MNTNPAYIDFVNSVQEAVFNGTRQQRGGTSFSRLYEHQYKDTNNQLQTKKYMFYGQSMRPESVPGWDYAKASGDQNVEFNAAIRHAAEYNLLVFTVQDVFHAEEVYVRASALFLGSKVPKMKIYLVGLAVFMLVALAVLTLLLVKFIVVDPIEQLTNQISSGTISQDNREKFISDILHRAEKKQRRLQKLVRDIVELEQGKAACNCLQKIRLQRHRRDLDELAIQVDEVEQLRIMYSQFFRYNSAIQAELELHRNFKRKDIGKVLKRKLLLEGHEKEFGLKEQKMVGSILQSKLAMMYQVEEGVNQLGPKHIGDLHSWWNSTVLDDETQFRSAAAKPEELFPMKDWSRYRCLGPLQVPHVSEQLLKQELFDNRDKFRMVKEDVRKYQQQREFEEKLMRHRGMSTY